MQKKRRNKHVCLRDMQFVLPNWINAYTESESCSAVSNSWQPHSPGNSPVLNTAVPFSRGSSQPRDPTQVSRIAGWFFTSWATREAQKYWSGEPVPSPADLPDPELNWGLLHCRQTLYQLSYQGSLYRTVHWKINLAQSKVWPFVSGSREVTCKFVESPDWEKYFCFPGNCRPHPTIYANGVIYGRNFGPRGITSTSNGAGTKVSPLGSHPSLCDHLQKNLW